MTEILIAGTCITGFSIFLLVRKEKITTPVLFSVMVLTLWFFRFFFLYLKVKVDLINIPWIVLVDQNLFFLDGVFLFWYTKAINKETKSVLKESFHLIPFLIAVGYAVMTYFSIPGENLIRTFQNISEQLEKQARAYSIYELIFILGIITHNLIYLGLSFKKVKKYNKAILFHYSNLNKVNIKWLNKFILIWLILLTLPLLIYFINYIYPVFEIGLIQNIFVFSLFISAVIFGSNVLMQSYANVTVAKKTISRHRNKSLKNPDQVAQKFMDLENYMQQKKPYLETNLTLGSLAEQLKMNANELSFIINNQSKGNFFEFVNFYRIESVKKALEYTDEQIIQIAYDNGFNSKSTFNEVFKKVTGVTPTQYRKNVGQNK
ncbi:helix-turn-helix domain-containing protein [Flavobacteriaceae bacterium R38]|nr:helix-turn-helix domain-containing protein [Flavobacteriaceae bacterium R38]